MTRDRWAAAVVAAIFLFAHGSAEAQLCSPQPFGVDPVNGNFTPTTWVEGDLSWVNNAMGGFFYGVWANTDFDMWSVGWEGPEIPIAAHFDGFSVQPSRLPGTGRLYGVWGSASNDVWAVGSHGLIVHWDGTQWLTVPSGTPENLYAVAGTSSDDVWAAGKVVMLHWDGSSWTNSPGFVPDRGDYAPGLGLAAISSSDAIVATYEGCQRWDGTSWHVTNCGVQSGFGIFAPSSNDIWVVGYVIPDYEPTRSYRAHWDGSSWSTTIVQDRFWRSIAGTGPSDIWINGTAHYDGTTWMETNCGPFFWSMSVSNNGAIMGVSSAGFEYFAGNDGWAFLARTNVSWVGLGGRDPGNLWAVGASGTVIRYDGSRWSGQDFSLPPSDNFLLSAFGRSSSDIWGIANNGFLRHFDGTGWTTVDGPGDPSSPGSHGLPTMRSRWSVKVAHGTGMARAGGEITLPIFGNDLVMEFWGTAPDDVWAVGGISGQFRGAIYHWNGDSWQRVYATSRGVVTHLGGSARDDAWFTVPMFGPQGAQTMVLHWDGNSVSEGDTFDGSAMGIAATSPNDVWLSSCRSCILSMFQGDLRHYDGVAWNRQPLNPTVRNILGVRGAGVFLTGYSGQIYQGR